MTLRTWAMFAVTELLLCFSPGPAVLFVIGGADGLAPALKDKASLSVAFGAATWPHQLARVMLLEQLYRAMTILTRHPYHRA